MNGVPSGPGSREPHCVAALRASIPDAQRYRLCYVQGNLAYFTTAPLDKQWGDDWDDAPYEHNAGEPYSHDGVEILVLAYNGPFDRPGEYEANSRWSVQDINGGAVAWLTQSWAPTGVARAVISAGANPIEFGLVMQRVGGTVFLPAQGIDAQSGETRSGSIPAGDESPVACDAPNPLIISLQSEVKVLREALAGMVYETTSLSPMEDDGSHWCKISRDCLTKARTALSHTGADQ